MIYLDFETVEHNQHRSIAALTDSAYLCNLMLLKPVVEAQSQELSCTYTVPSHTHTTLKIQAGPDNTVLSWTLTLIIQPHAHLTLEWIDEHKSLQTLNLVAHITLEDHAIFKSFMIMRPFSNRIIHENYHLQHNSVLEIYMLLFQTQDVCFHYAPLVTHHNAGAHTEITIRTLLAGQSDTILCGRLTLLPQASAVAHYQNHNLILSGTPKILAQPELEIDFDQVQCTHGVTLGRLDRPALFYMQSRGLSENESKNLLMRSFMLKDAHPFVMSYASFIDTLLNTLF